MEQKTVVIVGGGFGGIRAALDLAHNSKIKVILISLNQNFEYYPGLHKMLGISDGDIYTVPLKTIFKNTRVEVVIDQVTAIDAGQKMITTVLGKNYEGDFLIIALGSQTEYFNIQGLQETAFGFKSFAEAKKLREHMRELFKKHEKADKTEMVVAFHMIIVGAGPNGVDLAGEIAALAKRLAKQHGISESFIKIDLIEGASRVLPMMSEDVSRHVQKRLEELEVNVLCNRDLEKQESWTVTLSDMIIGARTLIWTAGITTNDLVTKIPEITLGKKHRVIVDEFLQAKGFENVFCVGDNADTQYSGLAQTAIHNAQYVARAILNDVNGKPVDSYVPKPVAYNIGVGPKWSVFIIGKLELFGFFAYIMRTLIDINFFLSILPIRQVLKLYFLKK